MIVRSFAAAALLAVLSLKPAPAQTPAPKPAPAAPAQTSPTPSSAAPAAQTEAAAPPAHPATPQQITDYLALTNAIDGAKRTISQNVTTSRANAPPYVPSDFWDDLGKSLNGIDLMKVLIPVYQRSFSEEDMTAALTFYRTPVGKRIMALQPQAAQGAGEAIRQEVGRVGQEVYGRHRAEIDAATKAHQPSAPTLGPSTPSGPPVTAPAPTAPAPPR